MTQLVQSRSVSAVDLRKAVFDEFKLAEDKIDRIGEFLFKIRTWAITANSGLIVAILSGKLGAWTALVGIWATAVFWHLERYQRYLRDGYSDRALALEEALGKLNAQTDGRISEKTLVKAVTLGLAKVPGIAKSSRRPFSLRSTRSTAEDFLYSLQLILLFLVMLIAPNRTQLGLAIEGLGELITVVLTTVKGALHCG